MTILPRVTLYEAFSMTNTSLTAMLASKHPRRMPYFQAWLRRYNNEVSGPDSWDAPASPSLLALSGRIITLATEISQ